MMKEHPILFSAPMVRAILEGRKTVTRRLVNPQPPEETPHFRGVIGSYSGAVRPYFFWGRFEDLDARNAFLESPHHDPDLEEDILWPGGDSDGFTCDMYAAESGLLCPFGASANEFRQQGDRLWVRETYFGNHYLHPNEPEGERELHFRADGLPDFEGEEHAIRWRPSIHMPRWASRITLEVTGVRVERLQEINEADAVAEGIQPFGDGGYHVEDGRHYMGTARDSFASLWESINGDGSWDANPWVWVVKFKRMESA